MAGTLSRASGCFDLSISLNLPILMEATTYLEGKPGESLTECVNTGGPRERYEREKQRNLPNESHGCR